MVKALMGVFNKEKAIVGVSYTQCKISRRSADSSSRDRDQRRGRFVTVQNRNIPIRTQNTIILTSSQGQL